MPMPLPALLAIAAIAASATAGRAEDDAALDTPQLSYSLSSSAGARNWTGFSFGLQLGGGLADASGTLNDSGSGLIVGGHLGYDQVFGDYILGAEVDIEAAKIDLNPGGDDFNKTVRLKLRGGIDLGGTYVYGTAGPAWGEVRQSGVNALDGGYFLGLGAQRFVTDDITVGGELMHHQFPNVDGTGTDLGTTTLSARVSFRF